MTENSDSSHDPSVLEARKRVKERAKQLRRRNLVPPVDEDEPLGPLSGGPEHLDLEDDENSDK